MKTLKVLAVFLVVLTVRVSGQCSMVNRRAETNLTATQDLQYLYSPGWRIAYYSNMNCKWLVGGSDSNFRVIIDVTYLNIENSPGCSYDGLSIYDGPTESSSRLGRMCNRVTSGQQFKTSGQFSLLVLRSDSSVQTTGFSLRYFKYQSNTPSTACTSTVSLTASSTGSYLTSPDFPNQADVASTCTWLVTASSSSNTVAVKIVYLDILPEDTDVLNLYDGADNTATLLASLSQDRLTFSDNQEFITTGDKLFIEYITQVADSSRSGFVISYNETASTATTVATVTSTSVPVASSCGSQPSVISVTAGDYGFITSPDYPEFYTHNLECTWMIQASSGEQIRLDVIDSSVQDSDECSDDIVTIYDGSTTSYPVLTTFCGENYQDVNSTGTNILISFKTDGSGSDRGFKIRYDVTVHDTPSCVGSDKNITELNATVTLQYITSTNYPNDYANNEALYWLIYNPSGVGVIKIQVEDSRIEASYPCTYDKVTVYKGPCDNYPVLGSFCGEEKPVYYQDTGSYVYITFVTDDIHTYKGFRLSYVIVDEVPSSGSTYLIVGAIVGGVLGGVALIALSYAAFKAVKKYKTKKTYRTASKLSVDSDDEDKAGPSKGGEKPDTLLGVKKS